MVFLKSWPGEGVESEDPYTLLGLSFLHFADITRKHVLDAYRNAALIVHPDKASNRTAATDADDRQRAERSTVPGGLVALSTLPAASLPSFDSVRAARDALLDDTLRARVDAEISLSLTRDRERGEQAQRRREMAESVDQREREAALAAEAGAGGRKRNREANTRLGALREESQALRESLIQRRIQRAAASGPSAAQQQQQQQQGEIKANNNRTARGEKGQGNGARNALTFRWVNAGDHDAQSVRLLAGRYGRVTSVSVKGRSARVTMGDAVSSESVVAQMAKGMPGKVQGLRVTHAEDQDGNANNSNQAPSTSSSQGVFDVPGEEGLRAMEREAMEALGRAAR